MILRRQFVLLFFVTVISYSQYWTKIDSVFSPFGVTSQNFSAPEYCDLDGDGDLDLIIGSLSADRIEYFVNKGNATTPLFRRDTNMFASIYAQGYQFTNSEYVATTDIDNDGDFDLVIAGYNGLYFFWNVGDSTEAVWKIDTTVFSAVNVLIGTDPKPALADLDGDGDEDLVVGIGESLFGGPTPGISMAFLNNGSAMVPNFVADNSLITGIPDVGLNAYPAFKDLDNDGDFDLVMGRDLQTMLYYKNTGTKYSPVWTSTGGIVSVLESVTYWKNPVLCDLDGDGDFDLTYGTSDGTIIYYQNIGTKSAPLLQQNLSYFQMIRTDGNASTVSFGDFDKDGDLDMVSGDWLGKFQYFRNDGTSSHPDFKKTTASFSSVDVGSYSSPVFIDIDKDGDLDIVSGALLGGILCYINTNGTFAQNTSIFAGINVGYRSAPAFADLNNDGNIDMLVGAEDAAKLTFYLNSGNNLFVVDNSFIDGITASRDAHPAFVDLDKDGDLDLAIGISGGLIYYYENTGNASTPVWKRNDLLFDKVEVHQDATPAFADFDGDGKQDMIVGEYNGNFSFYKNLVPTRVKESVSAAPSVFVLGQNYPNPFNPATTISFSIEKNNNPFTGIRTTVQTSLYIFDLLGRRISTLINGQLNAGSYSVVWDASNVPSGIYFYRLQSGNYSETKRMMLIK